MITECWLGFDWLLLKFHALANQLRWKGWGGYFTL